jgi:hypothetical protein
LPGAANRGADEIAAEHGDTGAAEAAD